MKQFRVVFQQGTRAGTCFAFANDVAGARAEVEKAMPDVVITQVLEELRDPLARYEPHRVRVTTRTENVAPAQLERKLPTCERCNVLLVVGPESQPRLCAECEELASKPKCTTCGGSGTFPGFAPGTFPCPTCRGSEALGFAAAVVRAAR